ncbi:MAG: hypothetical protein BWZ01_02250 [Deltaproteobacteria bacterium ADurb.BinA179]|nr:MAG: hypothetical protein BWZ01_02250 [Deltaproteobacteria bacterium ADurb.BinA179]
MQARPSSQEPSIIYSAWTASITPRATCIPRVTDVGVKPATLSIMVVADKSSQRIPMQNPVA